MFFFCCLIILASCTTSNSVVTNSETTTYRSPLSPLESLPSVLKKNNVQNISQEEIYIAWQVEHNNIIKNLNQSRLAVLEAHRRTTGHLKSLMNSENYRFLKNYLEIYDSLLAEEKRGTPSRILERKYKILQEEIEKVFQK